MASKIFASDLKVGMFVADLDRPWVDTPFLLQGFLIENDEQILALRTHCEYVMVDRARSTGTEFESVSGISPATNTITPARSKPARVRSSTSGEIDPDEVTQLSSPQERPAATVPKRSAKLVAPSERPAAPAPSEETAYAVTPTASQPGLIARALAGLRRRLRRTHERYAPTIPEAPRETAQEFAARADLMPPGVQVQSYVDQVSVEEEV